jgi:tetratricopeptide (TPR) repeat protein
LEPIDFTATPPTLTRDEAIAAALDAIAANDLDSGIELAQRVDALEPNSNIGLHLVGLISLRLNEPGKAVEAFEAASRIAPDVREHIDALAIVFSKTGRLVDGLFYGKLATAATKDTGIPGMLPDWLGTFDQAFYKIDDRPLIKQGQRLFAAGDYPGAGEAFRREVELDSRSVEGWRGFARALYHARKYDDALVASNALVSVTDTRAADLSVHGLVLAGTGRFDEALVAGREAEALEPEDAAIAWRTVQTQGCRTNGDAAGFSALVESWGRRFVTSALRPAPADPAAFFTRRVRLGVMSGHWAHGDGLDLIVSILEQLDRRGVELFVYADGLVDASLARRLRARANVWQDLSDLDSETAGFVVRNDALDVLIDLDDPLVTNHAAVIAQAPAPIALALHGDPATALAMGFTGVLGDRAAYATDDPRIVGIEGGLVGQPVDLPPLDPAAVRTPGTMAAFGTLAEGWQIGETTLAAWSAILTALPGAVLVLDDARLGGIDTAKRIAGRLPQDRLRLREPGSDQDYLASVDLLLDPIGNPFPDGLIAAAAQGTPGLTCRAKPVRANLAAGWLDRVGLPVLVADTAEDYVRKAVEAVTPGAFRTGFADLVIADRDTAAVAQAARLVKAIATLVTPTVQP